VEPRTARFGRVARAVLGRDLLPSDGTPEQRIRAAEEALRIGLPAAMREYYLAAGEADRLNRAHNILFRPEDLRFEQNYLIFMEENQGVVHWGIAMSELAHPDPTVWQRVNSDSLEWYSEEMDFSTFITKNLSWQAGIRALDEPI
jgi:hypothetical protein